MKLKPFEANKYSHIFILFCITTIGVYLRFNNIGALSIWNNEDYLAISVKSILNYGTPLFPTDIIYSRAIPYSYLTTLFVKLFGYSEFTLRAPAAIFSSFSIILTYIFGRQIFGKSTGLLAAALMSVFFWEIYTAQMARMYALFDFAVLLSLITIHAAEINGKTKYRGIAFFSVALTAFLHQISIALVLMLLIYIPYFAYKKINPIKLAPYILLLIAAIIFNILITSYYYNLWDELASQAASVPLIKNKSGFLSTLLETITPLKIQLFSHLNNIEKAIFYISGLILFFLANPFVKNKAAKITLATVIVLALFQQVLAGFITIAALFISQSWLKDKYNNQELIAILAVQIIGLILWLTFSMTANDGASLSTLKTAIKLLLPYPLVFFRLYLENYTLLSTALIFSAGYILLDVYRSKRFTSATFMLLLFFVPLTALGFHPVALERMYERYIYFLNPFYLLIISYGASELFRYLSKQWKNKNFILVYPAGIFLLASIFLSYGNLFSHSLSFTNKHYGENSSIYNNWLKTYYFHPDHKSASLFVAEKYKEGDVVIVMNILAHYVYFQKVDYQLTLSTKKDAEGWIGAKSINNPEDLQNTLKNHKNHKIWFIVSALQILKYQETVEFKNLLKLITETSGKPVYIARDGLTAVYCSDCN